jgi:hypothetical protein
MRLQKLSKAQIKESLEQTPAHVILSGQRRLTAKQKAFCKNIVDGMKQVDAHDKAYNWKGKRKNVSNKASELMNDARIQAEIEALERAKQFALTYSSAQKIEELRMLVVSQLTQEATNPANKAGDRISALSKLGQVAELGVFVTRSETKVIRDSADTKAELMDQLKKALADDARTVDNDIASLMDEISKPSASKLMIPSDPPVPDHPFVEIDGSLPLHSTPDKQSQAQ